MLGPRVQVPGYHEMTTRPNNAAVFANKGYPYCALCALMIFHYDAQGYIYQIILEPRVQVPGYQKKTIRPKNVAACGKRVTPNLAI